MLGLVVRLHYVARRPVRVVVRIRTWVQNCRTRLDQTSEGKQSLYSGQRESRVACRRNIYIGIIAKSRPNWTRFGTTPEVRAFVNHAEKPRSPNLMMITTILQTYICLSELILPCHNGNPFLGLRNNPLLS